MPVNEFRSIATFIQAAELGSLRQAALSQGLTPQAASKALAQLERHLGVRLFHRTTRSLALTEEGRRLLEATQPLMQGLEHALQNVQQSREAIAGPLHIIGPRTTLSPIIDELLAGFTQQHPEITPEILLDDRVGNWVEDRVDVGFRMGVSAHEGVIARRLIPLQVIACAAPAYLERHGMPRSIHDLGTHRCSVYRQATTQALIPWHFKVDGEVVDLHVGPAFSTNDEQMELQAVLRGQVIAQLAGPTAAHHIRSGRLVPLFPEHVHDLYSVFIYYGSRTALPARTRAFIDHTLEALADPMRYVLSREELSSTHAAFRPD